MATSMDPYLMFDGNAKDAFDFYRSALGGEISATTFGDMGDDGPDKDKVMHCHLRTESGFGLMGSDAPPGTVFRPGQNISVCLSGTIAEADELRGYWSRLTEGGQVTVPLEKQVWGDEFGTFVDRFGVPWMIDFGDPDAS